MDSQTLLDQIAKGAVVALIPNARRSTENEPRSESGIARRWYSMQEVAEMLGFGLNKVKMAVMTRELRSVKDGRYRRILPEWVDEYIQRRVEEEV